MSELLRFDWAAKHILRDKANFGILEGFLSELLKTDISITAVLGDVRSRRNGDSSAVELLESESNASVVGDSLTNEDSNAREHENDKLNRVDLLVKNTQGELILIEIQNDSEVDYFHRMLYGASKLLVEHLSKGEAYGQLKKVIAIHIVYFDLAQGKDYLYHGTTAFTGVYEHDELQLSANQRQAFKLEQISDIYPEYYLIKVKQFQDIIRDRFDEWAYFLKHEQINDNFQAKNILLAKEKLDVLKLPKEERQQYDAYLEGLRYEKSMFESNRMAALIEGEQVGLEKGELKKAQTVARSMIADGVPIEKVSQYTGLSIAEIEAL